MLELTRVFISENIIALFQKTLIAWKLLTHDFTSENIIAYLPKPLIAWILVKFCYCYEVGKTDVLHGMLDGIIAYDIFCTKEEDYVMKIMATYGSNCPHMRWQRVKARRTIVNGTKVEANHFYYRHCVNNNNHLRHMRPSIEETWKTRRWVLCVLAFFLSVLEVNVFLCYRYFVWNELNRIYFHAFQRALSIEMMQNTFDEDDGVEDSNQEPRRSPRQTTANNHELTSAPKNCTRWNLREGWIQNCKNPYQQVRCSTGCATQTRTFCSCDPGTFYCSACHVLHVHHVLSRGSSSSTEIKHTCTKNRQLNME
jgi:hypothetical protein